jgi:hypothetical protein
MPLPTITSLDFLAIATPNAHRKDKNKKGVRTMLLRGKTLETACGDAFVLAAPGRAIAPWICVARSGRTGN